MDDVVEHFRGLVDDETLELLSRYARGENVDVGRRLSGVVVGVGDSLKVMSSEGLIEVPLKCSFGFKLGDVVRIRSDVIRSERDFEVVGNVSKIIEGVFLGRNGSRFALSVGRSVSICIGDVKCERGDLLRINGFKLENHFYVLRYEVLGKGNVGDVWDRIGDLKPLRIVNLKGRVSGLFGERFKREKIAVIYLSDESGRIRVVLVGENASLYRYLDVGDWVEIYEGCTRIGYDGEMEVLCEDGLVIKVF